MIGIYILFAIIIILSIAEIVLNFAEIIGFFRFAFGLFSEGNYIAGIFMAIIAAVMIIALVYPAVKEMRKDKSEKEE